MNEILFYIYPIIYQIREKSERSLPMSNETSQMFLSAKKQYGLSGIRGGSRPHSQMGIFHFISFVSNICFFNVNLNQDRTFL